MIILTQALGALWENRWPGSGIQSLESVHGRPEPGGGYAAGNRLWYPLCERSPGAASASGADALRSWMETVLTAGRSPLHAIHIPLGNPVLRAGQVIPGWSADSSRRQHLKTR